ncbi:MAG: DASH family cryptochrome [Pseudanabaenaceae cyanobacterium bins.68]|nr:DASH family cryptochrome [Pseudanabaenaceae cyanobacterium bins.68]
MSSSPQRILIWYRQDLRIFDHQPLWAAQDQITIPFYCFDQRQFGETSFGFPKTGKFRAQFMIESVANLRQNLQKLGSDLIVRQGLPEQILPAIATTLKIDAVYFHTEVTAEEVEVEKLVTQALGSVKIRKFWGHTLHALEHLPFELSQTPELFTNFRKQVEQQCLIAPPCPAPSQLTPWQTLADLDPGEIPSLHQLIGELNSAPQPLDRGGLDFKGGETAAQARLRAYIWEGNHLKTYKQTRNQMLGADYSSKFSAWLALGCISARAIAAEVQRYEAEIIANDSTYWLIFELLWRDYFRLIAAKHGDRLFRRSGLQGIAIPWQQDWARFQLWQQGKTGFPLVDANMQELAATGFMSNRGRQNVASFLTKNLGIDWRMGAEWFESCLIDYDVCSNWGNWNYTAGVGNDARGFRFFNILKQSTDYDPSGEYVKHWLPVLQNLPPHHVHQPNQLSISEQQKFGITLGVDYPHPIVDLFKSAKANQRIYEQAIGAEQKPPKPRKPKR